MRVLTDLLGVPAGDRGRARAATSASCRSTSSRAASRSTSDPRRRRAGSDRGAPRRGRPPRHASRRSRRRLDAFVRWVGGDERATCASSAEQLRRRYEFDLVHSHDWLVAGAAERIARAAGAPWLVTVHATEYGRHQGWVQKYPQSHIHAAERDDGPQRRPRDHLLALHAQPRRDRVRRAAASGSRRSRTGSTVDDLEPVADDLDGVCARATPSPTSGSCCWSAGSSTRRASISRSTRSRR